MSKFWGEAGRNEGEGVVSEMRAINPGFQNSSALDIQRIHDGSGKTDNHRERRRDKCASQNA